MFRRTSIPFLSVIVVLLVGALLHQFHPSVVVVDGFAPRAVLISRHISQESQHRYENPTKNSYYARNYENNLSPRSCSTALNAIVASSSSSADLWLSQLPQLPQLPPPPTMGTIDPTTVLSDVFSTVLGTPLILAIPIVAALAVATLIAYLIVAYASPAEEE